MLRRHVNGASALAILVAASLCCTASYGDVIADSVSGWSSTGEQGQNGWLFGWRNFTADGGGDYNHENDFILFVNDFSGGATPRDYLNERPNLTNNWTGDHWRLQDNPGGSGGPWTELFAENSHPNGTNSTGAVEEHWTIRRWVATTISEPQMLQLQSSLRATNTNCGNGTTVHLYQNSTLLDTLTTNSSAGVSNSVFQMVNPNDVIDIVLSPAGADDARGDGCDGSAFSLTISDDEPPPPPTMPIADSLDDWSTSGTQGANNWSNGYYNLTQDSDGTYGVTDFTPFLNDGSNAVNPDGANHWDGTGWRLYRDTSPNTGPWTSLGAENTHPNGTNSAAPPSVPGSVPEEHWTIRRYEANGLTTTTPLKLEWHMRETNDGGTGVGGQLFIDGVEVDSGSTDNTTGFTRTYYANVPAGAKIDLALTPVGPSGDRADGADGSANRLTIFDDIGEGPWFNPTDEKLADSQAEFSDTQGQDNWVYGYYDQRADAEGGDGVYSVDELIPFLNDGSGVVSADPAIGGWKTSPNHWDGSKWDLLANAAPVSHGPWTEVTAGGGHPAANAQGDPEVHWAIRRWISETDDAVRIMGTLNNTSANGDGTVGRILVDGVEVWSELSNGSAVDFQVDVDVSIGSAVDFVIDSDGAGVYDPADPSTINSVNDGSDGTEFFFMITGLEVFEPIPEPSSALTLLMGIGMLGWLRRRGK